DFRVSTLPTIFGEKAVLRILDKDALKLDLTKLGFDPWSLEKFSSVIHQPYGMVLITGPTGSGKTTTLYSAIHTINSPDVNIMTAEDPVEYNLKGVNQMQINERAGRTFAAALRAFLRQAPDLIQVGAPLDLAPAQQRHATRREGLPDVQFHRHEGAGRDLRGHADQRRTPGRDPPERDHRGAPRDRAVAGHEDPAAVRPLEGARWDDDHRRGTPSHARLADGRRRSKGGTMAANMADLLQILVDRGGSDLHITSGTYPQLRITGRLTQLTQFEQLTPQDTQRLAYSILNETQKQKFEEESELDLSFGIQGLARFRCNVFRQRGAVGAAIRLIPYKIRSFD